MTRMAPFYYGKTQRTEIENVPCHSDPASCAAYEGSQGTCYFGNLNASRHSQILRKAGKGEAAQDDENGSVLLR